MLRRGHYCVFVLSLLCPRFFIMQRYGTRVAVHECRRKKNKKSFALCGHDGHGHFGQNRFHMSKPPL